VPEDFRDSGAIMYACFAQLQSWSIGVPMLIVLGTSSAEATYFGRIFLIEIFAVSSVVVVIAPKVIKAIRIRRNPELGKNKGRVNVTGVYQPTNSQDSAASLRISAFNASGNQTWQSNTSSSPLPNMQPLVQSKAESDVEQAPPRS